MSHRATQLIRFRRSVSAEDHRDCHRLLLENRNSLRSLENRLEQWMRVRHRLEPTTTLRVWMNELRLNRTRPDQRNLHHEVVHPVGHRVQNRRDLRATLDLKRSYRFTARDQLVR